MSNNFLQLGQTGSSTIPMFVTYISLSCDQFFNLLRPLATRCWPTCCDYVFM